MKKTRAIFNADEIVGGVEEVVEDGEGKTIAVTTIILKSGAACKLKNDFSEFCEWFKKRPGTIVSFIDPDSVKDPPSPETQSADQETSEERQDETLPSHPDA